MPTPTMTRRDFGRFALGSVAAVAGGRSVAAEPPNKKQPVEAKPPRKEDRDEAEADASVEELLLQVIRRRYPDGRLQGRVQHEIRRDITSDLHRSRVLGSFPLENGDEPGFVFAAYRGHAVP